ncbi:type III secretion system chaperone family protein [Actinomyces howellii]|uniref:Sensory transduction regulator n=1 Tax=Actinomyces howellii TaxID=52771 RepID=A0A448HDD8_9ACTO|nr:YbjN domain-containing protein [Actinomyces howellii]VEG25521.1 Uncharacterised protein [Actinomyces howellii]
MSARRRGDRISDFIARLVAKRWDERLLGPPSGRAAGIPRSEDETRARRPGPDGPFEAPPVESGTTASPAPGGPRQTPPRPEMTSPLTLDRVETVITGALGYEVQRHVEDGRTSLVGMWGSYPFIFEIPEGHDGWLLISGGWEEPAGPALRDELAAAVNDWNRDKLFPTVTINDAPGGPAVRASYLVDLEAGVTSDQLRLHVDTALFSCTQALSRIRPLLPEL